MILFKEFSKKKKKVVHDLLKTFPVPFNIYTKTSDPFYLFFIKRFEKSMENIFGQGKFLLRPFKALLYCLFKFSFLTTVSNIYEMILEIQCLSCQLGVDLSWSGFQGSPKLFPIFPQ